MVGSLLIMSVVTSVNMKKNVFLHKLILAEVNNSAADVFPVSCLLKPPFANEHGLTCFTSYLQQCPMEHLYSHILLHMSGIFL